MGKRAQNDAEKIARIKDAARNLISQKGYEDVTIRDICAIADVTIASFYRKYHSKDELLLEQIKEQNYYFRSETDKIREISDARMQLERFVEIYCDYWQMQGYDLARTVNKLYLNNPGGLYLTYDLTPPQILIDIFQNGQDNSFFRKDLLAAKMARTVSIILKGYCFDWSKNSGMFDFKSTVTSEMKIILKAFYLL